MWDKNIKVSFRKVRFQAIKSAILHFLKNNGQSKIDGNAIIT